MTTAEQKRIASAKMYAKIHDEALENTFEILDFVSDKKNFLVVEKISERIKHERERNRKKYHSKKIENSL